MDAIEHPVITASISDTIPPLQDRLDNFLLNKNKNPFDLNDPSIIEKKVEYDPTTDQYIITETIGGENYRNPTYLTFDQYVKWKEKEQEARYFNQLAGVADDDEGGLGLKDPIAKMNLKKSLVDRLFGGNQVSIEPQGRIDITFGGDFENNRNPTLPTRQQRRGGFDFDMDIQMSVTGKIGEKLNLNANYNTGATFNFDNQLKIDYDTENFGEDEIIKKIEAGNVSLPLKGSLITGSQALFGVKTELQFGHLRLTAVASQQQSQQENITLENGAIEQMFEVRPDEYDENRHFFLSHFNRESYERALGNLPEINSLFSIKNIEVWITDDGNNTRETRFRDVVALSDLGEGDTSKITMLDKNLISKPNPRKDRYGRPLPTNEANKLYNLLKNDPPANTRNEVVPTLSGAPYNLRAGRDFEKVRARRLEANEFSYNPELGFISLRVRPRENQVVAVAYEYRYKGEIYKVGDLTNEVRSDSSGKVLMVKLLKSTVQNVEDPTWDLMMKNVYPIGAFNITNEDFKVDIFYEAPSGKQKRFFEELGGYPLVNFFNLDNLNERRDPQPDGIFDFVPGITVIPNSGTIVFPVLEPFGRSMRERLEDIDPAQADALYTQYGYPDLYRQTPTAARFNLERNRFYLRGTYKSSTSSEISLGAFNLPPGSVTVRAGGQILQPGQDYEIDYGIGRVRILNDAILQSGVPINISFEDNTLFSFQTKTMLGLRADYAFGKDMNLGGTYLHLFEQPFTAKVNIGDDPINNRIFGLDFNMSKKAPWLTRAVDAIPFIDTKAESQITVQAEAAAIVPGHARAIRQTGSDGGVVYVDDFEGAASSILLMTPVNQWVMASIPQGQDALWPESNLSNDKASGANRSRFSWYILDPQARRNNDNNTSYTREVDVDQIFPNRQRIPGLAPLLRTFDVTMYPRERGPYNFDLPNGRDGYSAGVDQNNLLNDPGSRWAGIMKRLNTNDFEEANVEYIEFWLLNPYMSKGDSTPISEGGKMQIHLGNVSEDIFKDSRQQFENALPVGNNNLPVDNSAFGRIAEIAPLIDNAFDIEDRDLQDIGFDGLDDNEELLFFEDYVNEMQTHLTRTAFDSLRNDPGNDNFVFFGSDDFGTRGAIDRYRFFNNPQGNSRAPSNTTFIEAFTNFPDKEDLNRDKSLNENENYFSYEIDLDRKASNLAGVPFEIDLDEPAIAENVTDTVHIERGSNPTEIWYRFRVPVNAPTRTIGGIQNFRSIQFFRMIMHGFTARTTMRFAKLELARNQWRRYDTAPCTDDPDAGLTSIDVVNIEEHGARVPFNYVVPRGIQRERTVGTFADVLQNEQSIVLDVEQLPGGCDRSMFKLVGLDVRNFERIKMFVHGESPQWNEIDTGELCVYMRLGRDFQENYYEYEVPLTISREDGPNDDADIIWPESNDFDFALDALVQTKLLRNDMGIPVTEEFERSDPNKPGNKLKVKGNPTLGFIKGILIGVRNKNEDVNVRRDVEVWYNELRLTGLNERGGVAALARVDLQMADLGNMTLSGSYTGIGYGALDQQLAGRAQDETIQYDVSTNIELGKFLPKESGVKIPFYAQYSRNEVVPLFDPVDLDVKYKDRLNNAETAADRDSIKDIAIVSSTIKAFNFTNVRKERSQKAKGKPMPWSISNFSVSYFWSETEEKTPIIQSQRLNSQRGALDYTYSMKALYIEPFKWVKSKNLKFIKEINLNPLPNSYGFSTLMDREQSTRVYRFTPDDFATWQDNKFAWNRDYNLKWDLTRSLKLNFNANARAAVDELLFQPLRRAYIDPVADTIVPVETPRDVDRYRNENVQELGRMQNYTHSLAVNYNIPTKNIPFLSWVTARASYNATFDWTSGSLRTVDSLGSVISNTQAIQLSGDLNFTRLYDKWKYLKEISRGNRRRTTRGRAPRGQAQNKDDKDDKKKSREDRKKKKSGPSLAEKILIRPLLLLRSAKFSYQENRSTTIPGFMERPRFFGMSDGFSSPGWDFVAGIQPELGSQNVPGWLDEAGENGWISNNINQSQEVIQNRDRKADMRLTVEPFNDFKIDVSGTWQKSTNFSELFSDTTINQTNELIHQVPYERGSYTVSFLSLQTIFREDILGLFREFENMRPEISQRVGRRYGLTAPHDLPAEAARGYVEGYGSQHVDVVIPAFIAAYTGQTASEANLDYFNTTPMPNWNFNYNGLTKIPLFKDLFQNFSIRHGYTSTMTVNNFETALSYNETPLGIPDRKVEDTRSFYARYEIPTIVINEQFSPLLGVDFKTKNNISLRVDFKKSRNLSLQTDRYDLNEDKTTEYTVGFGYVIQGVKMFGKKKKRRGRGAKDEDEDDNKLLKLGRNTGGAQANDLEITFDFSLRDNIRINYKLDEDRDPEPLSGNKTLTISPAVNYQLNQNLRLRFFFDYTNTQPYVSNQFERTTMRGGITVQFQLN